MGRWLSLPSSWSGMSTRAGSDTYDMASRESPESEPERNAEWLRMLDRYDAMMAWDALEQALPPKYRLMIQGPNRDGTYSVGVVRNSKPVRQVSVSVGYLTEAFEDALFQLNKHLEPLRETDA